VAQTCARSADQASAKQTERRAPGCAKQAPKKRSAEHLLAPSKRQASAKQTERRALACAKQAPKAQSAEHLLALLAPSKRQRRRKLASLAIAAIGGRYTNRVQAPTAPRCGAKKCRMASEALPSAAHRNAVSGTAASCGRVLIRPSMAGARRSRPRQTAPKTGPPIATGPAHQVPSWHLAGGPLLAGPPLRASCPRRPACGGPFSRGVHAAPPALRGRPLRGPGRSHPGGRAPASCRGGYRASRDPRGPAGILGSPPGPLRGTNFWGPRSAIF
jgi:hypothetical protein